MTGLREDVAAIERALNGPPRDESFRGRLHKLENSDAAARAAASALDAARAIRADTWSTFQKLLVTGAAIVAAAAAVYNAAGG